jgi:hypothetical protein
MLKGFMLKIKLFLKPFKYLRLKWLCVWLSLFCVPISALQIQQQSSIGIFQFVADTIDVVGLEDEVSYVVRNELRKLQYLNVINQRDLELALSRNVIKQIFSVDEAVKAAISMNLEYVVIGFVSRENQQIIAKIEVVSPINAASIGELVLRFNNKAQIALQSAYIRENIDTLIRQHKASTAELVKGLQKDWLGKADVVVVDGLVSLTWELADPSMSLLGFNIYRALNEEGPFSYIASESELSTQDSPDSEHTTYYYQLSIINDEGEEIRSNTVISAKVEPLQLSSLVAPTVVNQTKGLRGATFAFFPSAENVAKDIIGYELLRRTEKQQWQVVATHSLTTKSSNSGNKSNTQNSIDKLSIADQQASTIEGDVEYAIRAFSAQEQGQLTPTIRYTPATPPALDLVSNVILREIGLGWPRASAGLGYRLYRKVQAQSQWQLLIELSDLDITSFTDKDIQEEGVGYQYAISVYDEFAETTKSAALIAQSRAALAPPTNVAGLSGLAKQATISWSINDDSNVTGYSIFRAPFTEDDKLLLTRIAEVEGQLVTSFIDKTRLEDDSAYYYSVASINKFNISGPVSKAVLVTTKAVPLPLENFSANLKNNAIELNWQLSAQTPQDDIDYVMIERSLDGVSFSAIAQVASPNASFVDDFLLAGASFTYRGILVDKQGLIGKPRLSKSLFIDVPLTLTIPKQNQLRKISLEWENATAPATIKVLRGATAEDLLLIAEISDPAKVAEKRYTDEVNLVDDHTYFVKIEAWLNGKRVAESDILSGTTRSIPFPKNLHTSANFPSKIKLNWDQVSDDSIHQYVIFRRKLADPESELISIIHIDSVNITEFVDQVALPINTQQTGDPIEHGVEYEYAIASKNIFDAIGYIGEVVKASSKPLPQAPVNMDTSANKQSVQLSWQLGQEPDLDKAVIQRKWSFQSEWSALAIVNATQTNFTDDKLYPFAKPSYRVSVTDKDGLRSTFANALDVENVKAVELFVVKDKMLREIQVGWQALSDDISFTIKRREYASTNWQTLDTTTAKQSQFTDNQGLVDQTEYEYQLTLQTSDLAAYFLGESNVVQAGTKELPTAPILLAQSDLVKKVALSWTATADPDVGGYTIYKVDDKGNIEKLASLKSNETSYVDEGSFFSKLDDALTYQYTLAGLNTFDVEGLQGELVSATTKARPNKPSDPLLTAKVNQVDINWLANPEKDIAAYEIYRGSNCQRVRLLDTLKNVDDLVYLDQDIKPGKSYCYKLKAIDVTKLESELSEGVQILLPDELSTPSDS